jgi:hemerythrin-like domain-containing protein
MKATQILMDEHGVIGRVLDAIDQAAQKMEQGQPVRPGYFIDAADFIKGFADGCHHKKEEGVLFKVMAENGLSEKSGPLAVMLSEHEAGRSFTRGMRLAAEELAAGDATAGERILVNARGYTVLLRQHILKENMILFPMADRVIPLELQDRVVEDFERVEHQETGAGVHEKYLALAEQLELEAEKEA